MTQWDGELEKRVWQRVRGQDTTDGDLAELIRLCRDQASDLRRLDRELYRQETVILGLLTGLHGVSTGKALPLQKQNLPGRSRWELMNRCRQRAARMLELCIRMETHERYGMLFTDIARQQRAKCARLEQMAGSSGR